MKNRILLIALFLSSAYFPTYAQTDPTVIPDSTHAAKRKFSSGFAIFAEFGVLSNSSFTDTRRQLKLLGVEPFGSLMSSVVLAKRMEGDRWISENRIILTNSSRMDNKVDEKRASLWGVGLGFNIGPKLVNTPKWNVFVPLGFDAMFYKLGIKSNQSASLTKLVNSPGNYQAVKLYSGSLNANAGIGVDYKTNIMPKHYEKFYISGKLSYHLPIASTGQWRGENVQVNDLEKYKPSQLYVSIGLVMVPKNMRMWGKMH